MKKLFVLLALCGMGVFLTGCDKAADKEKAPAPSTPGAGGMLPGSGGGAMPDMEKKGAPPGSKPDGAADAKGDEGKDKEAATDDGDKEDKEEEK